MDIDKIIVVATTYASEYLHAFVLTLIRPSLIFSPVPVDDDALIKQAVKRRTRVNPALFSFAIISIIIGFELRSILASGDRLPSHVAGLAVLTIWVFFAGLLHLAAYVSGGRASFAETATVTLQVLGVLYVLCNLVALGVRVSAQFSLGSDGNDIITYALVQAILLTVYAPLAVRAVHRIDAYPIFWTVTACGSRSSSP